MDSAQQADPATGWGRWTKSFLATACLVAVALWGFVAALDPFGSRVSAGQTAQPLMDLNQRFMYPQLVRSGAFRGAILGTSTVRLLDPARLSAQLGLPVANLAMNAATPWEQVQMAQLFARLTPSAGLVIWGIDATWCDGAATSPAKRLTPRPFPPWLYDDAGWNDWPPLVNLTTLEIAGRLLGHRLGLVPARIRGDGYEVFTPPEDQYDLARARQHLFAEQGGHPPDLTPVVPPEPVAAAARAAWRFPALEWLDATLALFPPQATKILVLPPVHVSLQMRTGSASWQQVEACKSALTSLAARRDAKLVDYGIPSVVTREDANYWDPLHYRLAIARRLEGDLAAIATGAEPARDGVALIRQPAR